MVLGRVLAGVHEYMYSAMERPEYIVASCYKVACWSMLYV